MMKGDFPVGEFAGRKTPFYFYDLPLLERTLDAVRAHIFRNLSAVRRLPVAFVDKLLKSSASLTGFCRADGLNLYIGRIAKRRPTTTEFNL